MDFDVKLTFCEMLFEDVLFMIFIYQLSILYYLILIKQRIKLDFICATICYGIQLISKFFIFCNKKNILLLSIY